VIDDLLAENLAQLERVLDLYLAGNFPKEMLTERKGRLQTTIEALERERADLAAQVETHTITDEQVQTVIGFAERVRGGLEEMDQDFEIRRQLIDALDVRATLALEDGEAVVHVQCTLGKSALSVVSNTVCGTIAGLWNRFWCKTDSWVSRHRFRERRRRARRDRALRGDGFDYLALNYKTKEVFVRKLVLLSTALLLGLVTGCGGGVTPPASPSPTLLPSPTSAPSPTPVPETDTAEPTVAPEPSGPATCDLFTLPVAPNIPPVTEEEHVHGPDDAAITFIEYADFQ
jgi:hypothetical protein